MHNQTRSKSKRKSPQWTTGSQSARGSFKHLLVFLFALDTPLIATQLQTLAAFVVGALFANSAHLPQIA